MARRKRKKRIIGPILGWISWIIIAGVLYTGYDLFGGSPRVDSPVVDNGRQVIISLPNGQEVYTYERYLKKENEKLYYQGEDHKIDLTDGVVKYKNWEKDAK